MFNANNFKPTNTIKIDQWLIGLSTVACLTLMNFILTVPNDVQSSEKQDDKLIALLRLGKVIPPVALVDTKGEKWQLHEQKEAKAIVVAFLDFKCPVSNRYVAVLNSLNEKYKTKGVVITAVICDSESAAEVDNHAKEFLAGFKVFFDPNHIVSNHFLAEVTPQCFLLDQKKKLMYFGAIDDQYQDRTTRLKSAKNAHLSEAIDQVLENKPVEVQTTQAIGCPLERVKKEVAVGGEITFYKDVLPLLQKHCQRCHRPGEVAPFQLLTFEDATRWADDIKDYVSSRKMPPWPVRAGIPLKDDFSLNENEIAIFSKWVDIGSPKGDIKDAPKPVTFPPPKDWDEKNPPDIILEMPSEFHLAAKGEDHYRMIAFPLNNKTELNIHKVKFIPGNKRIVHHELSFYDGTGVVLDAQKRLGNAKPKGKGDEDYGPGYESGMGLGFEPNPTGLQKNKQNPGGTLGVWVPGQGEMAHPPKAVAIVPPDSEILMQIHYHRNGKAETDRSKLALWLAKDKPEKFVNYMLVDTSFRWIPKNVPNFKSLGSKVVQEDCEVFLFKPHMHFVGKEIRLWHQPKNSKERKLLFDLRNWDYNWQTSYYTKEYYTLKKGDILHVEALFDNSSRNPNNPFNPPRLVFVGENDEDEMGYVAVSFMNTNRPNGHNEFLDYFVKLREGAILKKDFGKHDKPSVK